MLENGAAVIVFNGGTGMRGSNGLLLQFLVFLFSGSLWSNQISSTSTVPPIVLFPSMCSSGSTWRALADNDLAPSLVSSALLVVPGLSTNVSSLSLFSSSKPVTILYTSNLLEEMNRRRFGSGSFFRLVE